MPNVKDKALTLEDLKEALVQTGNALPAISSSDEGKIMRVDSEGNWSAEELPVYSGESGESQVGFRTATITAAVTANTLTVDMGEPWASTLVGSFSAIGFTWTETSPTVHRVQGCFYSNSYHSGYYSVGYTSGGSKDWWTAESGMLSYPSTGEVTLNRGVTAGTTYKISLIVDEV